MALRKQQPELGMRGAAAASTAGCGLQDLAFLPGQQNIYFTYRDVYFFWALARSATTVLT